MEAEDDNEPIDPTVLPFLQARTAYEHGNTAAIFAEIDMVLNELKDQAPDMTTPSVTPQTASPLARPATFNTLLPWGGLMPAVPEMFMARAPLPPPPPPTVRRPHRRLVPLVVVAPRPAPVIVSDEPMQSLVFSDGGADDTHPLDMIFPHQQQRPVPQQPKEPVKPKQPSVRPKRRGRDDHLTWQIHNYSHMF